MKEQHPEQSKLNAILASIEGILSITVNNENGNEISSMIANLSAVLASSSYAVALAGLIYEEKLAEVLSSLPTVMSATDKKLILTGKLSKEKFYLTAAERQNAALVHALDAQRSMLSFIKEEMKMNGQYNPNPQ